MTDVLTVGSIEAMCQRIQPPGILNDQLPGSWIQAFRKGSDECSKNLENCIGEVWKESISWTPSESWDSIEFKS